MKVLLKKNMAGPGFNVLAGNVVEVLDEIVKGNLDPKEEKLHVQERSKTYQMNRDEGMLARGECEEFKGTMTKKQQKNFQDLTAHFNGGIKEPNAPKKKIK